MADQTGVSTRTTWLLFALALLPLVSTPVLPFIDLYNHLARFFVLSHLDSNPVLQQNYVANWSLLPNIGLDVIGVVLLRFVPQALAAHVVIIGIFAVQFFGVLYFNRVLTGRSSRLVALLLIPMLYSYVLNWGFANFLLGLGLVFWAAGWWIAQRHRPVVAVPVACVFTIAIFLTHGVDFALYGILIGTYEIGCYLRSDDRDAAALARSMGLLLLQAVIPVALFLVSKTMASPDGLTNADESVAHLIAAGELAPRIWELLYYRLTTILRVEEGPTLWFDASMLVAQVALCAALAWRRRLAVTASAWLPIAAAALLIVVCPPAMFGSGYISDRMPLFFGFLLIGSLSVGSLDRATDRRIVAGLVAVAVVRLAATAWHWQGYARDFAQFEQVAALIPPGSLVADVMVGGNTHDSVNPRCQMYRPLLVSNYGQVGGLFSQKTAQPMLLKGPIRAALDRLPAGFSARSDNSDYFNRLIAGAGPAGFDYLLICRAELLTKPFPPGTAVIARTPRFTLLRVRPATTSARAAR